MKKILTFLLAGIMVFSLIACDKSTETKDESKEVDFAGEWQLVLAEMNGQKAPESVLESMKIVINNDGTVELIDDGYSEEGTWTAEGNEITLVNGEDENEIMIFELKDDQLVREEDGLKMVLERK